VSDPLTEFPVVYEQPVVWGDLDAHAHVSNVRYFRYMENARVAYYRRIGKYAVEEATGITLLVAETRCRFLKPVSFPDTVRTGASVAEIGRHHAKMQFQVVSEALDAVAAEGDAAIVAYDLAERRKVPFPDDLRRAIEELEAVGR